MNTGDATPGESQSSAGTEESNLDRAIGELFSEEEETPAGATTDGLVKPEGEESVLDKQPAGEEEPKASEEDPEEQELESGATAEDREKWSRRAEKRINKLSGKVHELEETLEEAKAARAAAEERLAKVSVAAEAGLPADYVDVDDAAAVKAYQQELRVRDWCRKYRSTGYEGEESSFTPEEVQTRLDAAQDRLMELAPRARTIMETAQRQAEEDRKLGRQIREERARKSKKTAEIVREARSTPPIPPKPGGQTQAPSKRVTAGIDRAAYEKSGRTAEGLMGAMDEDGFFA